ncbi:MAG: polysaccharide biosynthesis protein [Ichthyobacteriaceae bacterium]|nr:polysaccharide biosynthesis protein [Ichthyobacteriaceae bacterium]
MTTIKQLLSQTAIYGLSSVIGRVLNFLLVPLYTAIFAKEEYGEVSILYALTAMFNVFLTYGMETTYFNFISKKNNKDVFSTSMISIIASSVTFLIIALLFSGKIAHSLTFDQHPEYIKYLIWVLTFDAVSAIPFANLRHQGKAFKFAIIRLTNIAIFIGLNILLLIVIPALISNGVNFGSYTSTFSTPKLSVIFISNLIASAVTIFMLIPTFKNTVWTFNSSLWKSMIKYGWPILIAGTAGIINETMDKYFLLNMLPEDIAKGQIGIYSANYKISIFMTLFIQAFRMGVEPFFFAKAKDKDAQQTYAYVMNYFIAAMAIIFLGLVVNLDILKHFIQNEEMWEGLGVVPILLLANLSLGIYLGLSVWYKVTELTRYGAWFSFAGAIITITLNIWLIPIISYYGSAWATLASYSTMMILSYVIGQRIYPIPYNMKKIVLYISSSIVLGFLSLKLFSGNIIIGNIMFVCFILMIAFFESTSLKNIILNKKQ